MITAYIQSSINKKIDFITPPNFLQTIQQENAKGFNNQESREF
jgi:hypothetical protein